MKHMHARMHLSKEMVDEGRLQVVYKKAEDMEADGFSKPYDLAKHAPFAELIQGELKASQQVGAKHNRDQAMEEKLSNEIKQESELDKKVEK